MAVDFTEKGKKVYSAALGYAHKLGSDQLCPEHLIIALIEEGTVCEVLSRCDVDFGKLKEKAVELAGSKEPKAADTDIPTSQEVKSAIEFAMEEARNMHSSFVGTEHIFLGLLDEEADLRPGLLQASGLTLLKVRAVIASMVNSEKNNDSSLVGQEEGAAEPLLSCKAETPILDEVAIDLTAQAAEEKLSSIIGREAEIQRVLQILSRLNKNNPILIGEPGVGKTAVVEGLAIMFAKNAVPEILHGKRVLQLNIASLVAGTKYRGEFEEKITKLIKEVKESGNIIVFIDEIHTIVGAGGTEGAVDAANILKPSLARGEIQIIGATTTAEYRKYIERDSALERRFQPVFIEEPAEEAALEMVSGLRETYEKHHRVKITDEALKAAVSLSKRYITDRFLPDKAIDLIDEAASKVKLNQLTQDNTLAEVSANDIAEVVSNWSKIPVAQLTQEESDRLLKMETELAKSVIGQDEALYAVSAAVRRARSGLRDPKRPVGSFMFLGPTGVGKTQVARALAKFLFGSEDAMIRLDMSEFMERHEAAKLIGPPPGYMGYEQGGILTEAIRKRPYSVVLFDEVEKAHPEVYNMLLQLLDDGRLTDGQGHTADFRDAIIIFTSNLGVPEEVRPKAIGFGAASEQTQPTHEKLKSAMIEEAGRFFRPEFLNRIDELIVFKALDKDVLFEIIDVLLARVIKTLAGKGITVTIDKSAKEYLLAKAYNPKFGARPLRRAIQTEIEDELATRLLSGTLKSGGSVIVTSDGCQLLFK